MSASFWPLYASIFDWPAELIFSSSGKVSYPVYCADFVEFNQQVRPVLCLCVIGSTTVSLAAGGEVKTWGNGYINTLWGSDAII